MLRDILILLLGFIILFFAYKKNQLTNTATLTALTVGLLLYFFGGFISLMCLYLFFVSSAITSNIHKNYKSKYFNIHEKGSTRDSIQVLANSLIAVVMAIIYYITKKDIFLISIFISFASFNSDTWASELGIMSKEGNIYLIGLKKVQKGISGAVTKLGLFFSFIGAFVIGILYLIIDINFSIVFIITIFGFLGALIDSIFGQMLQALYYDKKENKYTERRYNGKVRNKLVKGYEWINNDVVNFVSPICSVILYLIICIL